MAQRTAFLNSDAKWFNKDFHHTWISNYMLKQPWVMFSNYSTKPEFALGNWQISWGKAIIRCTRTTGTFAGEEILACFESTSTENISTAWNKKVYIEIPEVYVNDSTAITDSLTQWANLNVWRIVSSDSYPTHSNYIPLWEITNGDWQNATDLRPEVLRRGKPNTLSYFGGNGEEERIDIDNSSLNKYLMSNWAWVAPSWEEWGGWGWWSGENFKRTFTADEDLLAKSMFWVETLPTLDDIDTYVTIWNGESDVVAFNTVLNWEDFSSITLNLKAVNSPADSLTVRIETLDDDWFASWTLIDVWATGTVTPTGTAANMTVNLWGTITGLTAHTKVAVVLQRTWTASSSNYFQVWAKVVDNSYALWVVVYKTWDAWAYRWTTGAYAKWCVSSDWFASEALVQATTLNKVAPIWYCETWVLAWNDFTWILDGTVDYPWATSGTKYYLIWNGTLSTSWSIQVWQGIKEWVLSIFGSGGGWSADSAEIKATAAGDMNAWTIVYVKQSDWKIRPIWWPRGFFSTELYLWTATPDAASQSNVWLKTVQITSTQALNVFTSNNWYITLCLSGDLTNFNPVVTDYICSWAFDVCSPKDGYAAIIYRDRSTQYPSVFMVKVSDDATTALSVSASVTVLENYAVKWNISVWVTRLQDADATMFCALWTRNYREASAETEDWKTRYCICSFSDLTITAWTLDVFNWNLNESSHTPFWYLWNWNVWTVISVANSWTSDYRYTIFVRQYSNWNFAWGSMYETLVTRNSGSFTTAPQILRLWWDKCFVSLDDVCYICATYPDTYVLYSYNKAWHWGQFIRYYMADWGKHLMKVDMHRNQDNTYWTMHLTKYKVWDSSLVELKTWTFSLTDVNVSYSMPQLTEIWYDNTSNINDADWDYYIYYLKSSWIVHWESNAIWGRALWVLKENVSTWQQATVVVAGAAPWTFSAPWKQVYINWSYAWETESDYPIWVSISTTQFVFNK